MLFAFALNNQELVELHFFFGKQWHAPMALVALAIFVLGMIAGIVVMLPLWLTARRQVKAALESAQLRIAESQTDHGT